jgi:DNA polymerase-3 subunit gamma/tau
MMALSIGGPVELMRTANPNSADSLRKSGQAWGTMTLLSTLQLLDETIVRMKHSVQSRILLEVALVQICNLQDLQLLSDVVQGLASGHSPPVPTVSRTPSATATPTPKTASAANPSSVTPSAVPSSSAVSSSAATTSSASMPEDSKKKDEELTAGGPGESRLDLFRRIISPIQGVVQQAGWMALEIQPVADGRWRIHLARDAKFAVDWFRKPENEGLVREALRTATGHDIAVEWLVTDRALPPGAKPADTVTDSVQPSPNSAAPVAQNQRIREAMNHPLIKRFMEVFDGHVVRVDDPSAQAVPAPKILPNIAPSTSVLGSQGSDTDDSIAPSD